MYVHFIEVLWSTEEVVLVGLEGKVEGYRKKDFRVDRFEGRQVLGEGLYISMT